MRDYVQVQSGQWLQVKDEIAVPDEVEKVFETGEKEICEVKLSNGMNIECTIDHKFLCSDKKFHTILEIIEGDMEVLYEKV